MSYISSITSQWCKPTVLKLWTLFGLEEAKMVLRNRTNCALKCYNTVTSMIYFPTHTPPSSYLQMFYLMKLLAGFNSSETEWMCLQLSLSMKLHHPKPFHAVMLTTNQRSLSLLPSVASIKLRMLHTRKPA